ncbi:hypothetical protein LAZ67_17001159 [Cordylochernes scorpioides]|uniref:Uncharacterized protein n=1 Tax=Cordylochernes scorpioides TaxID=51811 RepID=A0ABY6LDA5_9ARAC|nr:hypothetical protein LAZ67_17001159 [Cordylochernes scorpioides]
MHIKLVKINMEMQANIFVRNVDLVMKNFNILHLEKIVTIAKNPIISQNIAFIKKENFENYTIDVITACNKNDWMIKVKIEIFDIECKIDIGSQCNVMPIKVLKSLNTNKRLEKRV